MLKNAEVKYSFKLRNPVLPRHKFSLKTNLEHLNHKYMPVVLLRSLIKIWEKSVKGFVSFDRAFKQKDKQRLPLYM